MYRLGIRVYPPPHAEGYSPPTGLDYRSGETWNPHYTDGNLRVHTKLLRRVAPLPSSSVGGDGDADDYNLNGVTPLALRRLPPSGQSSCGRLRLQKGNLDAST